MLLSSRYNMASKIIKHSIEIAIQPEFKSLLKSSWIRNIVKHTLKEVVPSTDYSVSVAVIDDQTMRDLNFQFRNFDETTDVLAFGNHGEFEIDQMLMMRPFYGSAQYQTPIKNLYLCSAGTHPGGGITGINGQNAAKKIIEDQR